MGSTKRLNLSELLVTSRCIQGSQRELWLHPHGEERLRVDVGLGSPSSAAPSEDVSPECVAPAVMLVPPPYGAATQSVASSRSANITVGEDGQTDIEIQDVPDEPVEIIPRRIKLSVDCETGHESPPRNLCNLRSISGSSSDVPLDTDGTSGDTDPRQTSSDTTHTVLSSSQPSVENESVDTWTQQPLLNTSAEMTAAPVCGEQLVASDEGSRVTDRRLSCELHSVQDHEVDGESITQEFGDKGGDGSKERLVVSASSEDESSQRQELLLPDPQTCSK